MNQNQDNLNSNVKRQLNYQFIEGGQLTIEEMMRHDEQLK